MKISYPKDTQSVNAEIPNGRRRELPDLDTLINHLRLHPVLMRCGDLNATNPEVLQGIMAAGDAGKTKEVTVAIIERLGRHQGNPRFIKLGERLEDLRKRFDLRQLESMEFLKLLLALAREVLEAEQETDPAEEQDLAKNALSELFVSVKTENTPIIIERLVDDIDEIVRAVRFLDWQKSTAGEREVKKALRKVLFKYKLQNEQDLFDKAYAYIRQYYAL